MRLHLRSLGLFTATLLISIAAATLPLVAQTPATPAEPETAAVEAVEPFTVRDRLDQNSSVLEDDGTYYNPHPFEGSAGQSVVIELSSDEVDTYLILQAPDGRWLAQDDDTNGSNSRLVVTLPLSGTYTILANSYASGAESGSYTLTLRAASTRELALAEANRLLEQGYQQRSSQPQEALQSFEQALALYRANGDRAGEGTALNSIGLVYGSLERYSQALEFHEQALAIAREVDDRANEGTRLNNIGFAYNGLRQHERALDYYQQALSIAREVNKRANESITLSNIGALYQQLADYSQALDYYQQALEIRQAAGYQTGVAATLSSIGSIYGIIGPYSEALNYQQQALLIYQELDDRSGEADTLNSIGWVYDGLGEYDESLEAYQQALTIQRELKNRISEGITLGNIGSVYGIIGPYSEALNYHQQALAIHREVGNRRGEGTALGNIGVVYGDLGQYSQALDYQQQALNVRREVGDREGEGTTLNNIGSVHGTLGQNAQALDYYQQALAIFQEISDRESEGIALNNIGQAYSALKNYSQALNYYQQALVVLQDIGYRAREGSTLNSIGQVYQTLEQYPQALDYYQQALAIHQEVGSRPDEGATLNTIGAVYRELGQYDQSLEHHQRALSILREVGDLPSQTTVFRSLGKLWAVQNQPELAIAFYKQSINLTEQIRGNIRTLSPELQQSYAETIAVTYRELADLLLQQNRVLEAQQVLDLLKVQELDDYLHDVRGNAQTASGVEYLQQEQDILSRYNALQQSAIALGQELNQLQQKAASQQPLTPAEAARRAELVQLQDELNQQFNQFARTPEVRSLIEQLDFESQEQTVSLGALDRLRDQLDELDAVLLYPLILDDRIELIITTPNAPPLRRTVEGVGRTELNEAIVALRQALEDPRLDAVTPAQQLYQWLIEPLEADLAQAQPKTIIYAPDGQLRYIPLAALHDGTQWLAQRYAINNITSASLEELDTTPSSQPRVLAGAFADRETTYPVQVGDRSLNFRGLPFAGAEVQALSETLPSTTTFVDRAFDFDAIRPQMNAYNILHFATHAAFVPGDPSQSFILFGDGDRPTLRDVESWSLQNVDLVVLSACETGLGGFDNNGAQILGLGYQFQSRGARAVIASLWQVSDGGTQVLMNAFYSALGNGMTKAAALQAAQIALITGDLTAVGSPRGDGTIAAVSTRTGLPAQVSDNLNHPYYWAPFILIGNGL